MEPLMKSGQNLCLHESVDVMDPKMVNADQSINQYTMGLFRYSHSIFSLSIGIEKNKTLFSLFNLYSSFAIPLFEASEPLNIEMFIKVHSICVDSNPHQRP